MEPTTSTAMMSNNKRRRVSDEGLAEDGGENQLPHQHPEAVESTTTKSSANAAKSMGDVIAGGGAGNSTTTTMAHNQIIELFSPVTLEEIPALVLAIVQEEHEEEVADALQNLTKAIWSKANTGASGNNVEDALRLGAHSITIGKMRKYQYNERVQCAGCIILANLSVPKPYRVTIVKAGGMEAVVNALKVFPDSKNIQSAGLTTCAHILINGVDSTILTYAMKRFVYDLDGFQLAVSGMTKFPEYSYLIHSCCGLFAFLAEEETFHKAMRAAGVVGAVGNAVDKFFDNPEIKRCAKVFMKRILGNE